MLLKERGREGGLWGVKVQMATSRSRSDLEGNRCPGVRGGLCSQETEDSAPVRAALKPTVAFEVSSRVNMMPESILQTDVFYISMNYLSKEHKIYPQTSAT